MKIIGRRAEQETLRTYYHSGKPEFIAVYGRRRIGKTFLIKESFNNDFAFQLTGLAKEGLSGQLRNFQASINRYSGIPYPLINSWFDAFEQLIHLLENTKKKSRKVIFLDELPWLDTHKSGFISALEHFWNGWASARKDIMLIVCGSATSWIINKLIKDRGGLHNRITKRLFIEPFTLSECEEYYKENGIVMNRMQVVESYMIFGGIPYYLSLVQKGKSLAQNIDSLCFAKNGELSLEFSNLYASLFKASENHIKIVEALSKKNKGLTRKELIAATKLANGGTFSKNLEELEQCGFIKIYNSFNAKSKFKLYQLIDFYTLFYLNFILSNKNGDENFWSHSLDSPRRRAWSGYAFEQVCQCHVWQIKRKLGISGILTKEAAWKSQQTAGGAQIDLLIDRNDGVINICEMKYYGSEFSIDKKYDLELRNKSGAFQSESKTKKALHLTMITTYGVKKNEYSGTFQSEVLMDDLFYDK